MALARRMALWNGFEWENGLYGSYIWSVCCRTLFLASHHCPHSALLGPHWKLSSFCILSASHCVRCGAQPLTAANVFTAVLCDKKLPIEIHTQGLWDNTEWRAHFQRRCLQPSSRQTAMYNEKKDSVDSNTQTLSSLMLTHTHGITWHQ